MKSLTGRFALITGASKGLGKAMALALAEAGATVALLCDPLRRRAIRGAARELLETHYSPAPAVDRLIAAWSFHQQQPLTVTQPKSAAA